MGEGPLPHSTGRCGPEAEDKPETGLLTRPLPHDVVSDVVPGKGQRLALHAAVC